MSNEFKIHRHVQHISNFELHQMHCTADKPCLWFDHHLHLTWTFSQTLWLQFWWISKHQRQSCELVDRQWWCVCFFINGIRKSHLVVPQCASFGAILQGLQGITFLWWLNLFPNLQTHQSKVGFSILRTQQIKSDRHCWCAFSTQPTAMECLLFT